MEGQAIKSLRWIIAAVSLVLVLMVALWESQQLTSPGPLHPSHANLPELQGIAGCVACHGEDHGAMSEACNVCHQVIDEQIAKTYGLHGSLTPEVVSACARLCPKTLLLGCMSPIES